MASRKALIVHDSDIIRLLFTQYLMSEFENFQIWTAESQEEAVQWAGKISFDLILSADLLRDATVLDFYAALKQDGQNQETPCIVISQFSNQHEELLYHQKGLKHWVSIPVSPIEFSIIVHDALSLRSKRRSDRFYVSGLTISVDLGASQVRGEVYNLSHTSLSCLMEVQGAGLDYFQSQTVTLSFPEEYESLEFKIRGCKLLQAKVVEWDEELTPKKFHVVWVFGELEQDKLPQWESVFDLLEQDVKSLEKKAFQ